MVQKWFNGLNSAQRWLVRVFCCGLGYALISSNWEYGNQLMLVLGWILIAVLIYLEFGRKKRI